MASFKAGLCTILTFLIVCLSITSESKSFEIQKRIAGGNDAQAGEFPYVVALYFEDSILLPACTGSIIDHQTILTSARCVMDRAFKPNKVYASVGTLAHKDDATVVQFDKISIHPEFDEESSENDLAILRTIGKMKFSNDLQKVALPTSDLPKEKNSNVVTSGWGLMQVSNIDSKIKFKNTKDNRLSPTFKFLELYDHFRWNQNSRKIAGFANKNHQFETMSRALSTLE